ncbi:hypothetical protein HDU98_002149 [Podochytrium sp. JEL0797]|nr:hypothetical protein HDU98_002149 [Podochytrium sp. JEL0797]
MPVVGLVAGKKRRNASSLYMGLLEENDRDVKFQNEQDNTLPVVGVGLVAGTKPRNASPLYSGLLEENDRGFSFPSADNIHTTNGTLSLPATTSPTAPIVVLVAGSGDIDRDGNAPILKTQVYAKLADHFADIGVASLQFDKRGVVAGSKTLDVFYSTGVDEHLADTIGAVRFAKSVAGVGKVIVCGHSEGALTMGRLCAAMKVKDFGLVGWESPVSIVSEVESGGEVAATSEIDGAILLSGFGQSIPDAAQFQRDSIVKEIDAATGFRGWCLRVFFKPILVRMNNQYWKEFVNHPKRKEKDAVKMFLGMGPPFQLKWWRDHFQFDLLTDFRAIECPVLVVGGGKDSQCDSTLVTRENVERVIPNAASVEICVVDNMTHMLRDSTEVPSFLNLQAQYGKQVKEPLSPELLKVMTRWIQKRVLI